MADTHGLGPCGATHGGSSPLSGTNQVLYSQAINYLNSLSNYEQRKGSPVIRLKKIKQFLQEVDNPQKKFLSVHIAGTNAKGTIGNFVYTILKEGGHKVGFFSSPHLISIRERLRGSWFNCPEGLFKDIIPRSDFASLIEKITLTEKSKRNKLSFFETLTAIAFLCFAQQKAEIAVIETGMGGRWDATNVVNPLICAITSIGFDHSETLGKSLSEIAAEKAGIIKKNSCVISVPQKQEVGKVLKQKCRKENAELFEISQQSEFCSENIVLARKILERLKPAFPVSQSDIKQGLKKAYWPARLEKISITRGHKTYLILLDGGHNVAAMRFLRKAIEKQFALNEIILIFSACRDKHIEEMSRIIFPLCKKVIFTQFKNQRCETLRRLRERTGYEGKGTVGIKEALAFAQKFASGNNLILITGSLYLVGEAFQATGSKPQVASRKD